MKRPQRGSVDRQQDPGEREEDWGFGKREMFLGLGTHWEGGGAVKLGLERCMRIGSWGRRRSGGAEACLSEKGEGCRMQGEREEEDAWLERVGVQGRVCSG